MTDRDDHPKFHEDNRTRFSHVDPIAKKFSVVARDRDGYSWDINGRYVLSDSGVLITAMGVEPSPLEEEDSVRQLTPVLYRKLTAFAPIKDIIRKQEISHRRQVDEARMALAAKGRSSSVLDRWDEEAKVTADSLRPWRSRIPDARWATWAEDYVERVREWGGSYRILKTITDEKAWGIAAYETNRDRLKTMRRYGWISGQGPLVEPGPRLVQYHRNRETNDG